MSDDIFFSSGSGDDGKPQPYTPVTNPATSPDYRPNGDWNSPDTAYLAVPPPGKKKRTVRTLVGAGVAGVLVLAAAGGAYAYSALASHGAQPETVVPATAVAFAKLDLDPAADQKIAVFRLARKFPDLAKTFTDKDKLKDSGLATLFSDNPNGLDYDHDIKPWLGSRIAVAYVPDSANPVGADAVLIAGYTDEAKMKSALARYQAAGTQKIGYTTRKGFVLISDTQAHAAAIAAAAEVATLDGNPTYRSDTRTLRGNQIALGRVDVAAATKLALDRLPGAGGSSMQAVSALKAAGRLAMGVHAEAGYLELSGAMFGVPHGNAERPARSISALPANTSGAFEISGLGALETHGWTSSPPAYRQAVEREFNGLGLRLPGDFAALLGTDLLVSSGPPGGGGTSPFAVQVATGGGARGVSVIGRFFDGLNRYARQSGGRPLPVTVQLTAKGYAVTNEPSYATSLQTSSGATLGSTPLFRAAVPHADGALAVGFFNVGSLLSSPGVTDQDRRTLTHLGAVGFSLNQTGGATTFDLRVTVKYLAAQPLFVLEC